MIVKGAVPSENPFTVYEEKDIPADLPNDIKEQIQLALKGFVNVPLEEKVQAPSKIVVYVVEEDAENYDAAQKYFSLKRVSWLCCPSVETDNQKENMAEWVKTQREEKNRVKVILPDCAADHEGIINFATKSVTAGGKAYATEKYCSRIAGLLAGLPSKMASTFAVLPEVEDCEYLDEEAASAAVDAGKFILYNDGEKVKVGRGVNSLTTAAKGKSDTWKKIKVVETMDMIYSDLAILIQDYYIGKYPNTYDNKCLVIGAVRDYLEELTKAGLLDNYNVDFNEEQIREYILAHKGYTKDEVMKMDRNKIIRENTDEKLFMIGALSIVDALEDVVFDVAV